MSTGGQLLDVGISLVWLACVVVSVLKSRFVSAIIGVIGAVAIAAGWIVGGWYILNPLQWIPVWTAVRLARPNSWWSNRFYSKDASKFARAVIRYGLVKEYIENRRKVLTPEEFKSCLGILLVTSSLGRNSNDVRAAINEALNDKEKV